MDVEQLQQTILEGLATLEGVQTVSGMPKRHDTLTLPAVLVDLAELEPARDPGTGELGLLSHWEARVVMSDQPEEAVIWHLVVAILFWLFDFDWSTINVGRAQLKQAAPDHFSPMFQGHRVWLIEWVHDIRVGNNVWDGEGITVETFTVHWPDGLTEETEV